MGREMSTFTDTQQHARADRVREAVDDTVARRPQTAEVPEVSIVMPCLNEAETLGTCIRKAYAAIERHQLDAEVIVADNGSTDGSPLIAEQMGARLVPVREKGYGSALRAGILAARGTYVIMGDADDSYDFSAVYPFLERLRDGYDLVMGNRFRGGIRPGAMPWKHRWIGNPILTRIGRLFFPCPVGDFQCGLRAFTSNAFRSMDLKSTQMEFASEMVVKASLMGMRITEVPTILHKDGRSRPPHLRSWRDGWRNLRFLLLYSPRWLFLLPGLFLFLAGALMMLWLVGGARVVGPVVLDIHTLLLAAFLCLIGHQVVVFAVFTKVFAIREGFHPPGSHLSKLHRYVNLELGLTLGVSLILVGLVILGVAAWGWRSTGFGRLDPRVTMREVIPAVALLGLGAQTVFASFFLSILGIPGRGGTGESAPSDPISVAHT